MTYFEGLLPIKSHEPLITWFCGITWQTKSIIYYHNSTMTMTVKLGRMVTYCEVRTHKVTWPFLKRYLHSCNASEDLVMNGVRSLASVPTHAIFILGVWLLHALFSGIDLICFSKYSTKREVSRIKLMIASLF